ncbi:MAG TPA: hypothetical protein VJH71_03525 [Candidatus Paceibacterota bacterium]
MLIATLPPVHLEGLIEEIVAHPLVGGVRYNLGAYSAFSPKETLERILSHTKEHGKKFWLDIKGRQLRINRWTMAGLGRAELNHSVAVDLPARVYFRGGDWCDIKMIKGNVIYFDSLPKYALGEGQALNIVGENLEIDGYLTEDDLEYLSAAGPLGIKNYMLSFVEGDQDVADVEEILGPHFDWTELEMVLKIESPEGMKFVELLSSKEIYKGYRFMAARDDWFVNTTPKPKILKDLKELVRVDPNAILASHIFGGLEKSGLVSMADYSDLYLMRQFGYRNFMLSDGVSIRHFDKAILAWQEFIEEFPEDEQ